jgi:hypothetical protein
MNPDHGDEAERVFLEALATYDAARRIGCGPPRDLWRPPADPERWRQATALIDLLHAIRPTRPFPAGGRPGSAPP